jgi:hypothetical protein
MVFWAKIMESVHRMAISFDLLKEVDKVNVASSSHEHLRNPVGVEFRAKLFVAF